MKACTKAVILSYVPVENPSRASDKIILFLIITNDPGPSEVPYADISCITGGNTNARANGNLFVFIRKKTFIFQKRISLPVAHKAPIKEINKFNLGTNSAIETEIERKIFIYGFHSVVLTEA